MVELKVAALETVNIKFGGSHGYAEHSFVIDDKTLTELAGHQKKVIALGKEKDDLEIQLEMQKQMTEHWRNDSMKLRDQIEKLKNGAPMNITVTIPPLDAGVMLDSVREACQAAIGRTVSPRWQPIETAPKDEKGPPILLCDSTGRMDVCYWFDGKWMVSQSVGVPAEKGWRPNATHWMPLPEPPK